MSVNLRLERMKLSSFEKFQKFGLSLISLESFWFPSIKRSVFTMCQQIRAQVDAACGNSQKAKFVARMTEKGASACMYTVEAELSWHTQPDRSPPQLNVGSCQLKAPIHRYADSACFVMTIRMDPDKCHGILV